MMIANDYSHDAKILDVSCGDGVGLQYFKSKNFANVVGVDFQEEKVKRASSYGYPVYQMDFHNMEFFQDNSFDVIYSSHSLEHALNPYLVLNEFYRIAKLQASLIVVLPYPDNGPDDAHCSKYILGTTENDGGIKVIKYIESFGFKNVHVSFDSYREPEIWLKFIKVE